MTQHSAFCVCTSCWASCSGAYAQHDAAPAPRFVHRKSVGDSFGVWIATAATMAVFMWMAYEFWKGLLL